MIERSDAFGEIVQSSLTAWTGQCWQWNTMPAFGSLVVCSKREYTFIGLVTQITTGSSDPSRTPLAYQKTEEELLLEQPQIFCLLRTTFSCAPLGYYRSGQLWHILPPYPPPIHAFLCTSDVCKPVLKEFFSVAGFLSLLFSHTQLTINLDELLLAMLHDAYSRSFITYDQVIIIMKNYLLLVKNDYRRTRLFVQRLQAIVCW
jgi:hypothetical protein